MHFDLYFIVLSSLYLSVQTAVADHITAIVPPSVSFYTYSRICINANLAFFIRVFMEDTPDLMVLGIFFCSSSLSTSIVLYLYST